MTASTRIFSRIGRLPRALTHNVKVERKLHVPMPDGAELLADHYYAANGGTRNPIVLVRSPYGRASIWGLSARLVAERGFQVVLQSVRGTFGSGGVFEPLRNEASDGLATLRWIEKQSWFSGKVGMMGPSYLGFAQWALATNSPPPYLSAIAVSVTASEFRSLTYPSESFALDSVLSWIYLIHHQEKDGRLQSFLRLFTSRKALSRAFGHLPLNELDELLLGTKVGFYQEQLAHNLPGDLLWKDVDYSRKVKDLTVPVSMVAGWYDIFLPYQLKDYVALKSSAKATPFLTIGPWSHSNFGMLFAALRESLSWFNEHLLANESRPKENPVRIFVMGKKSWLDLPDWPPKADITCWYLQSMRGLSRNPPSDSPPDTFDYDPENPTPSVGGIVLGMNAGPRDNRKLESRPDVLTYTSLPFDSDCTTIGPVSADLYVESDLEYTDFFVRLCDVSQNNRSKNVCDGLIRLSPSSPAFVTEKNTPSDRLRHVAFDLWPTAYCFLKGHRLRVQVSSGAHPRYNRNLGSGETLATASTFKVAHQKVFHDASRPSSILLPVFQLKSAD